MANDIFKTLFNVNVSDKTEKKNNLTYLSWAYAWGEVKKAFPDANYTIYENDMGWNYHTDGRTCWVKVSVTIGEITHMEYLPVMDFRNSSIPLEKVTSVDVTKAIQRAITKACARHGLGLYIYAGDDLPEEEKASKGEAKPKKAVAKTQASKPATQNVPPPPPPPQTEVLPVPPMPDETALVCEACGEEIKAAGKYTAEQLANGSKKAYGMRLCSSCIKAKVENGGK